MTWFGLFGLSEEMVAMQVSFDRDEGALSEHERRLPRYNEGATFIVERFLNQLSTVKLQEFGIIIVHPFRALGCIQGDRST